MKFGAQLKLKLYPKWKEYYIPYNKFKRMLNRFEVMGVGKKQRSLSWSDGGELLESPKNGSINLTENAAPTERTPLAASLEVNIYDGDQEQDEAPRDPKEEFYEEVNKALKTAESFYKGKEAELTNMVRQFEDVAADRYSLEKGLNYPHLRKVYTELVALKEFCSLNKEGFRKIVKKFDKTMGQNTLSDFMPKLKDKAFCKTTAPDALLQRVQKLISRDKLLKLQADVDQASDLLFPSVRMYPLLFSVLGLLIAYASPLYSYDPAAHRCLAVLVFTIMCWCFEAIPYFATALLVPILVVLFRVLEDPKAPGTAMSASEAANVCLSSLVNHTTILILGGYSVSAAFSRCEIELMIASFLQKSFGKRPKVFILAMMFLGLFLSMWISNHTSPVLCLAIIDPIIRDFDNNSPYTKALLLGIAFACNFGGMMTPISSMQNALAVSYLGNAHVFVSFGRWIAIALPICILLTFVCWLLLIAIYNPSDVKEIPVIVSKKTSLTRRDIYILGASLLTIVLWSTLEFTKPFLGDLGTVSLLFMVFMFGSGMLTKTDFDSFSWHTLFLLGGGSVLGKAITSSHLLDYIVRDLFNALPMDNKALLLLEILLATLAISTFISHTVAALILLPLLVKLGTEAGDAAGIAVTSAFAVSAAMALPFSSFPNVMVVSTTDDLEHSYVKVKDFVISGLPMSLISLFIVGTLGYVLIKALT